MAITKRWSGTRGGTVPRTQHTFGHPGPGINDPGADGVDRFAIASFTVTEDGEYAISNSQLTRQGEFGDGVEVAIHVNNQPVTSLLQVAPTGSGDFNTDLGLLWAGDTIFVGVGPDGPGAGSNSGNDGIGWDFSIVKTADAGPLQVSVTVDTSENRIIGDVHELVREQFISHSSVLDSSTVENANASVTIDVETQRFLGDVSALDRDKFFTFHSGASDPQIDAFMSEYDVSVGRQFWGPLPYALSQTGQVGTYPNVTPSQDQSVRPTRQMVQTSHPRDAIRYDTDVQAAADWVTTYYTTVVNDVPSIFEPMNEPFVHAGDDVFATQQPDQALMRQKMAELYAAIGERVDQTPALADLDVVGYASAWPSMELWDFGHWESRMKMFMDIAGEHMDGFSTHLYDGVNVAGQNNRRSGSNSEAILDLIETYSFSKWGTVKPHAITEYGGIEEGYGDGYSDIKSAQSIRAINHILFNLLEREDDLFISIPFITDKSEWFLEPGSCEPYGGSLFRLPDPDLATCTGTYDYTWRVHFYDLWKDVQGDRGMITTSDPDVQAQLFVDGDTAYVAVNNLADTTETVDLEMISGLSGLQNVQVRRMEIPVSGALEPTYVETTLTSAPQSITLDSGGTTVLVYQFDSDLSFSQSIRSEKYYTSTHLQPITANQPISFDFTGIQESDSGLATLRMGMGRKHDVSKTPLVTVNGTPVDVPDDWKGYDQANRDDFFGVIEIPVPIAVLTAHSVVEVTFPDSGGRVSSMILNVESIDAPTASSIGFAETYSVIPAASSYTFDISYKADVARDVAVELWDSTGFLDIGVVTVQPGSGTASVPIDLPDAASPGPGYYLKAVIRPVGASWQQNLDAEEQFGITVVDTALPTVTRDYVANQLGTLPTRTLGELVEISDGLANDGNLFDTQALSNRIDAFSADVLNGTLYDSFRRVDADGQPLFPNAPIVRTGSSTDWPEWLRTNASDIVREHGPLNFDAYAQLVAAFYDEADLQVPLDRQYFEITNAPWVNGFSEQDANALHLAMVNALRSRFPDLKIGGPAEDWPRYNTNDFGHWGQTERFIQTVGGSLDFHSLHLYDSFERTSDGAGGVNEAEVRTDALRTTAILDLLETTTLDEWGAVQPIVISEFGTRNQGDVGNESVYPEALQQWHQIRSIIEKMMVFMDRPDRIDVATPTLSVADTRRFEGIDPSLWGGIANSSLFKGPIDNLVETHLTKFYQLLRNVRGRYIDVSSDSPNLQVQAFRDGNRVHVLLNNTTDRAMTIDVAALLQQDNAVDSATLKRLRLLGGVPTLDVDIDVSSTWGTVDLDGEESAALTLTLSGPELYDVSERTNTFYGTERVLEIGTGGSTTTIHASLDRATSAKLRVGISRAGSLQDEQAGLLPYFTVSVNNGAWTTAVFSKEIGSEDQGMTVREFEIPVSVLADGANTVKIEFLSEGGHVISSVLEINQSVGDFNDNGIMDEADRDLLFAEVGNMVTAANGHFDLNTDGVIDLTDGLFWDRLRGAVAPTLTETTVNVGGWQPSGNDDLSLEFSGLVEFGPNAFSVVQTSDPDGPTNDSVQTSFTTQSIDGNTHVTLTFDSHTRNGGGALLNGNYELTVHATDVTSMAMKTNMENDAVYGDTADETFFALYGDTDRNRLVNLVDFAAFRSVFGLGPGDTRFNAALDFDGNSLIDLVDFARFRSVFGISLDFE